VAVGSVIITKLDGHAKGGGALSAVAATKSPIVFVGTGEHMDDFELFNTKSFVSRLLDMGDISGLLGILEDQKVLETVQQQELYKKITEGRGEFTFRDMREQFQNLLKLGPLSKVMSMIPGLSSVMGKGQEQESVDRIKRFMTIMDSMTANELDGDNTVFNKQPARVGRIARGAGVSIRQVHEVLETFKPFQKVARKMSSMGAAGLDRVTKAGPHGRMPGQVGARQLSSMFTPQMIQKMGGLGNIQNMMKKMSSGSMPGGLQGLMGMG